MDLDPYCSRASSSPSSSVSTSSFPPSPSGSPPGWRPSRGRGWRPATRFIGARSTSGSKCSRSRSAWALLSTFDLYPGARKKEIEIQVAEPYAAEAGLLESRVGIRVRPRANDYELAFPAAWLDRFTPIASLPSNLPVEALAAYGDRSLPRRTAEAVLIALELHRDLPIGGIDLIAAEIGLSGRTLQRALRSEGVTYRDIVQRGSMRAVMKPVRPGTRRRTEPASASAWRSLRGS